MNNENLQELAKILDDATTEEIIALQQFLNAVVIEKVSLASQNLGLVKEVEQKEE